MWLVIEFDENVVSYLLVATETDDELKEEARKLPDLRYFGFVHCPATLIIIRPPDDVTRDRHNSAS